MLIRSGTQVGLGMVLATVLIPGSASGDVISGDDVVFGIDSITVDTEQGLEFLDLTHSTSRSVNQIMNEFGVGGDFEGFRRASAEEVLTMVSNAGFVVPGIGETVTMPGTPAFTEFVTMTGIVGVNGGIRFSRGLVTDAPVVGRSYFVALEDYISAGQDDIITTIISSGNNDASGSIGHWLVRETVPAPGTLALLLPMVMTSKRRR